MGLEKSQLLKTLKKIRKKGSEELEDIADSGQLWFHRTQLYKTIQAVKHAK